MATLEKIDFPKFGGFQQFQHIMFICQELIFLKMETLKTEDG